MSATNRPFTGWVSQLAAEHTRELASLARREGLSATDALDAVQEAFHTFLLLPQARGLVIEREEAAKLLMVIVRNAARNLRRRHHHARPHIELGDAGALADTKPQVDALLDRVEDHVRLLGCIALLSDVQRHVVTLRMLDELSGEETAAQLGLTSGHVAVLLHRARKELERCMIE